MTFRIHVKLFVVYLVSLISLSLLLSHYIPYLGNFPYKDIISAYAMPSWVYAWASFDGAHYIHIALQGYHEYDQAFFPGYSVLIHVLGYFAGTNYLLVGLLISWLSYLFGSYFFYKMCEEIWGKQVAKKSLYFLAVYPFSFFFYSVYTESLFLLCTCLSVYFFYRKAYAWGAFFGFLSALVRLQGVFIIVMYIFLALEKKDISWKKVLYVSLAPIAGLGVYMTYLWHSTGDPLFFFTSQPQFGAQRSTSLIPLIQVYYRYLKIFLHAQFNMLYFVAFLEIFMTSLALIAIVAHAWNSYLKNSYKDLGLVVYSGLHIIVPALTGTFSSMPRYSLFVFSLYVFLAHTLRGQYFRIICFTSLILQVIFAALFLQGYFIS